MKWLLLLALLLLPSLAHAQAMVVTSCGSAGLTAGSSHFVTVDVNGQSCQSGAGSGTGGGCSQATAYLARATGEVTHASDLTTLICGLVTDGVWAKLDALYVMAQQTQADAQLNLVGTIYSLTPGTLLAKPAPRIPPVFTPYVGYSGFVPAGLNGYLDTGFNPTTASSPKYVQNSANMGVWSYANTTSSGIDLGIDSTNVNILASYSGSFYARVNGNASGITTPGTKGLYAGDRSSSSGVTQYWNGASQATPSSSSVSITNNNFVIGNVVGGSLPTSNTLSEAHIGASLGSAGNLALYNRLRTYMTSVGVP